MIKISKFIFGLALCLFAVAGYAATVTSVKINGPTSVPFGSFSPNVAVYSVTATYSDGSQKTGVPDYWTRTLDNSKTNGQFGGTFNIDIGGFATLQLTATVGLVSDSLTIVTSTTAVVPSTTSTPSLPSLMPPRAYPKTVEASVSDMFFLSQTSLFGVDDTNTNGGIDIGGAWRITKGDPNLVVGIIDMGVLNHADLSGRLLQGYSFVENTNSGIDPGGVAPNQGCFTAWHGTNVAGIIGANANSIGVAGINWQSKLLPVRAVQSFMGMCNSTPLGLVQDPNIVAKAIRWASGLPVSGAPINTTPAKVLNISLLGQTACTSPAMASAVADASANGTTVVISTGNEGVSSTNYSLCPDAVWVTAVDQTGSKAYFSNMGPDATIAAPGFGGITTLTDSGTTTATNSNTYTSFSGTSASAPFVTGVVSLMLSVNPSLTPKQVKQILTASARTFPTNYGAPCTTATCGAGIVDAAAAVTLAAKSAAECVFDWAEKNYPTFFNPTGKSATTALGSYQYRYYPNTNSYLALMTSGNRLQAYNSAFGDSLLDLGPMSGYLQMAGC